MKEPSRRKIDCLYNTETKLWVSSEGKVVAQKVFARLAHKSEPHEQKGDDVEGFVLRTWYAQRFVAVGKEIENLENRKF